MSLFYSYTPLNSDDSQTATLHLLNNITTGLSLLGTCYFFFLYCKIQTKTFSTNLVANLIFSDLCYSIANILVNFDSNPHICFIEGFMREYTMLVTLFWAMTLAFSAYAQSVKNMQNLQEKYWIMKLLGYGIPLLICLIPLLPFVSFEYGIMGTYCWISHKPAGTELPKWVTSVMLLGYICLAIVLSTYWYIRVYLFVRSLECRGVSTRKLFMYPVILLVSFFPIIVDSYFWETKWSYQISLFHMITQHSNGFLNAVTYGLQTTKPILEKQKKSAEGISVKSQRKNNGLSLNNGVEDDECDVRKHLLQAENTA